MPNGARATGVACLLLIAMSSSPLAAAGRVWFVPWKVLEPGAQPIEALFTLYWIPGEASGPRPQASGERRLPRTPEAWALGPQENGGCREPLRPEA